MLTNKKNKNLSVVFNENKLGLRNNGRNSYVSSALIKGSNNSSVANLKQDIVQMNKSYYPIGRKNFSYSPLIKKITTKDQCMSNYGNSILNVQLDNHNRDNKSSFSNFTVNYDKDLKERLNQSRNNSYKYSFNNVVTSTSFDKNPFLNETKNQSKGSSSQSFAMNNTNIMLQNKNFEKPLFTEFIKIEENPNETSLYNEDIKNGISKTESNKIINFERECDLLFKKLESKSEYSLISTVYKEILDNAVREIPAIKNFGFLFKIFDGYSQIVDSLINQIKLMQPSYSEFEKFYGKYENLHQKYTEARRELDYRAGEINRLKTLLQFNRYENGIEGSVSNTDTGPNLYTDQAFMKDDDYVFSKKIKYLNQNNVDDLDAMYFPDRVIQKTKSFSEDKSKVPKLNFQKIQSKYKLNQTTHANGAPPNNLKIANVDSNYFNENYKQCYNIGGRSNIIKIQSKW